MAERVQLFIDGAWVDAEGGAVFDAVSPSTGEVLGSVAEGTRADAQRAIHATRVSMDRLSELKTVVLNLG